MSKRGEGSLLQKFFSFRDKSKKVRLQRNASFYRIASGTITVYSDIKNEVQRTNAYKTIPLIVANVIRKLNMAKYSRKFLKPYKELGIELEKTILLYLSFLVLIKEHKEKAATSSI